MHCRNCANELPDRAVVCVNCGLAPDNGNKFCNNCGRPTNPNGDICTECGVRLAKGEGDKDRITTMFLCLFFGWFGAHRFYTGHTGIGIIQLFSFGGCGIWTLIDWFTIAFADTFRDAEGKRLRRRQ